MIYNLINDMTQQESILKKFYFELTDKEKPLLGDYIKNPSFETLSETFDSLVGENENENEYEDKTNQGQRF